MSEASKQQQSKRILRAGSVLLAVGTILGSAIAAKSQEIPQVSREKTAIFEMQGSRVAIPTNMNPYNTGQNFDQGLWQASLESLFYLNLETGELTPWLATGYSFNDDGTELTIKLREGVTWQDGVPFTSEDVVFTIEMLKSHSGLRYSSDLNQWVKAVSAPDAKTVTLTLTKANPRFVVDYFGVKVWTTLFIAPKHIWKDVDPMTFANFDLSKGLPMGTGPYKMVRSTQTEAVYDRNDEWWGAKTGFRPLPVPQRLVWIGLGSEDARAAALVNDNLDAAWVMAPASFRIAAQRNPDVIAWEDGPPYSHLDTCPRTLYLNNGKAPFNDVRIRHAIDKAIDRKQLIAIVYDGMNDRSVAPFPSYAPIKAFLDRNKKLFDENVEGVQDAAGVTSLMEASGYKKDDSGVWAKDGTKLSFEIVSRSHNQEILKIGPVVVAQLKKAGFDATFRAFEDGVYYSDVGTGKASAWVSGACGSVIDPYSGLDQFHSRWSAPIGQATNALSASRFSNPTYDGLVDTMSTLNADDPAFQAAADKALEIWVKELPAIPLAEARLLTPFSTKYWTNWPTAKNPYIQPTQWWATANQMILNIKPRQ